MKSSRPIIKQAALRYRRKVRHMLLLFAGQPALLAATLVVAVVFCVLPVWGFLAAKERPRGFQREERHAPRGGLAAGEVDEAFPAQSDRAVQLVRAITSRWFESRGEVATERALRDFDEVAWRLEDLDLASLKLLRRGAGWVQVEGSLRVGEGEVAKRARLFFVERDGSWMLDRLKVVRVHGEERSEG